MMTAKQLIMARAVDLGGFDSTNDDGAIFLQHDMSAQQYSCCVVCR